MFGKKVLKLCRIISISRFTNSQSVPLLVQVRKSSSVPASIVNLTKMKMKYPTARRDESVIDVYHGFEVADPYRWMEDPDSDETKEFIQEQNEISNPFIKNSTVYSKINSRLKELWNFPKYSCPYRHGNKYFYFMNTGLQNQNVFYVQDSLDAEAKVFLDPNVLSSDGTVAISRIQFSEDEKTVAYSLNKSGSDWMAIHFKDVETGKDYEEQLEKVKCSSIAWTHDNKGIFYGRYPDQTGKADGSETDTNTNQKLYYHRLGTPQSEDVLVVEFPEEPNYIMGAQVSDCGRWLLVTPRKDCKDTLLYYSDLHEFPEGEIKGKLKLVQVIHKLEADYDFITNDGPEFIFRSNKDAPNYRLIKINFNNPDEENWTTIVPQHESDVLDWAFAANKDKLVLCYIHDVKNVLQLHDLKTGGLLKVFPLDVGCITDFSGKLKYSEIFYQFTSFLTPGRIFRCDLSNPNFQVEVFREIKVEGLDATKYETKQVFYKSKDGTKIPMFIVHKKGLKMDGKNPTLLTGYGGFNISIQPYFSVTRLVFIQHLNGILAVPNLRGGGEYGQKWHDAGRLFNKQNVFDDAHAAAEYLAAEKYTSAKYITIQGASNGGLLVAACINQRPELYGAAIAQVGVLDMLRFHKFTIGSLWVSDYGCSDDKKHFENLFKFSPLHNIKEPDGDVQYPATLLLTASHDDRVVPLHSLKYVATLHHILRNSEKQTNPILIRVETKAGHGGGKPTAKVIEQNTDILSFITESLNLNYEE